MSLNAIFRSIFVASSIASVAACTPMVEQRGNLPDPVVLESIEPGVATRSDVANMLGSPSSVSTFDDETWYYIAARIEKLAFYKPEVLDQRVVAIAFDENGRVRSINRYNLDDAREIDPVDRVTPTSGNKLTFLQQLFGNLGRFANKGDSSGP